MNDETLDTIIDREVVRLRRASAHRMPARLRAAAAAIKAAGADDDDHASTIRFFIGLAAAKGMDESEASRIVADAMAGAPFIHRAVPTTDDGAALDSDVTIEIVGGALPRLVDEASDALLAYRPGPVLFQRGGALCRVFRIDRGGLIGGVRRAAGSLQIGAADVEYLRLQLTRSAIFTRYDQRMKETKIVDAPRDLALGILANKDRWPFPVLRAVIETPTLRTDGSILDQPGYDASSGLLFDPGGIDFGTIPRTPSRDDAVAAVQVFRNLFAGFAYESPASFSVTIAYALTALVRAALRTAPMTAISAPAPASGKSLIVDAIAMIATGRPAAVMSYTGDGDEERKRLFAVLRDGASIVSIDNVEVPLASDALCSILTQSTIRERVLGVSASVEVPTCATFSATGNNFVAKGDLATRTLMCRLDPKCEHPEEREFKVNLYEDIPKRRPELVRAALTILRAYIAAGRPSQKAPAFGRFEDWSAMVRAPLLWLGLDDPCSSRGAVAAADPVSVDLQRLVVAWEAGFGSRPTTTAAAILAAHEDGSEARDLKEALAPFVERGQVNARRLGKFISKYAGRVIDGLRFEAYGDTRTGQAWTVRVVGEPGMGA